MFRKNSGIEKFQAEEGGSFTVWSKIFLSHRTEKTSPVNHSVFQEISRKEKIFMDKRGEGGITIFRPKVFVSLYQNISFENTLVFQKNSFIEIFHAQEGRGITGLSKIFVSHYRNEKLCKGTLLSSGSGIEKKLGIRGGLSRFSVEIFMSHSGENFLKGILLFLRKFLV